MVDSVARYGTGAEPFPQLLRLTNRLAGTLSGGEQQMVAVGRALMAQPVLLAVDELSLGLAPMVVDDLAEHLVRLNRERGMAVLLVEKECPARRWSSVRAPYVLEAGHDPGGQLDGAGALAGGARRIPGGIVGRGRRNDMEALFAVSGQRDRDGCAFALVATGFVAIYRVTRVVNFAQGVFAVVAGMLAYTLLGAGLPHGGPS